MIFFTKKRTHFFILFFLVSLISGFETLHAQTNPCPNCWVPVTRQNLLYNQSIPSSSIRGYVEFLPDGYNPNANPKYPLVVNLHGQAQQGSGGSVAELCLPACEGATIKIEQHRFPEVVVYNGVTYRFIVLTPQYNGGTSSDDLSMFIDYAIRKYAVDPKRVYLTGLSLGSNVITNYMGSSPENAKKIAAIAPLAICNTAYSAAVNNIANNNIHYWGVHAGGDQTCGSSNTTGWANAINNAKSGLATATITPVYNPQFPHDIFSTVFDINWAGLPDNNLHKQVTEWMIQYQSNALGSLPATLGNYTVSLKNKQVSVNWTTNLESNTDYFVIERAGPDMQFKQVSGKIQASGNSNNPITYSFSDAAPIKGTSFYRLVLMNKDGLPDIFEIKKVINREFGASFSISPVPANKVVEVAFELDASQQLNFSIRDINGQLVKTWSANFSSGYGNLPIDVSSLKAGIYHITVQSNTIMETKKFIKQ